ncbi:EAL domain-containing protein [uncultured Maritalea sp.]|uniref:EAL domain-containing protein n=1 Tax=uncultured Maritalea sp. TaxID=757249 RepID=UPI002601BFCD|nr:EAL domain-containing protein [uncultured Maritalea sp.]
MRAIVLFFLAVACLSIGITTYFALGFTVIESFLVTIVALLASFVFIEALFRRRTETYLVNQTESIARQLSNVAKTSEMLSDQVSFLSGLNMKDRTDNLEADVSVLGTVVRQLAEAVAEMEEAQAAGVAGSNKNSADYRYKGDEDSGRGGGFEFIDNGPVVPIEAVQHALANNEIEQFLQPIVSLPQRRTLGYELMPKLRTDDGVLHEAEDFLHYEDNTGTIAELEQLLIRQAANIVHRANITGDPTNLFVPISLALLRDKENCSTMAGLLASNRAVSASLMLTLSEATFDALNASDKKSLAELVRAGAGICLDNVRSLRLTFQAMSERGVKFVKADAQAFINNPLDFTDFHRADLADYVERFGIGLIMDNVTSEDHVLELLDDKIPYAQGKHIAQPSPVRPDLASEKSSKRSATR